LVWYNTGMSKIDKAKEYIGAIKVYMGFLLASLIATITGTSKLYLSNQFGIMFWLGILGIVLIAFAFMGLVRHLHKKIDDLEEL